MAAGRPRSAKAKAAAAAARGLRIVHLPSTREEDQVFGTAACGRPAAQIAAPGWEAHEMAEAGEVVSCRDACFTCRDFAAVEAFDGTSFRVGG